MQLRGYQHKAIDDLRDLIRVGCRRVLLVAPTGAGKTVIAAQIVQQAAERFRRVIFFAHHRELIEQCANKLYQFGVDFGIIMAGEFVQLAFEVQVASIDTFRSRVMKRKRLPWPKADLIVIDEAHRSLAKTYMKVIEHYPDAVVLGLTATPIRSDRRGLGHVYEGMAQCPQIYELQALGHLVPERTFCPTIPDLTGIRIRGGDYDPAELEARMNHRPLVGNIVEHWFRHGSSRQTVVFASGVKHSMALRDEFKKYIDRVAHIDGETPLTVRQDIIRDLHRGYLQVVTNFNVLTEGFDEPRLAAGIIARPTKNRGVWIQMGGRVLRVTEDGRKKDSLIFDHSGNTYVHGYLSDHQHWSLEEGLPIGEEKEKPREFAKRDPICCINCARVYEGQINCPHCGHIPVKRGKRIETRHGDLVELNKKERRTAKKKVWSPDEKEMWMRMLMGYAEKHGKNRGMAYHYYRRKFRENYVGTVVPMPPSHEVQSWVKGMMIRYAKGKAKARAAGATENNQAASTG